MDLASDESKGMAVTEEWKDVKGYEGIYQISSYGRVKSTRRRGSQGGILKLSLDKKNTGYFKIRLCKSNHYKSFFIHRLVAQAFIANPNNYPQVNHKDENRQNNNVDNLEWCTNKYNSNYGNHSWRNGRAQRENLKWVCQYSTNNKFIAKYKTAEEAAKAVNGFASNISKVAHGSINTAYGYKWKYEN